jgi:hypothetical protein
MIFYSIILRSKLGQCPFLVKLAPLKSSFSSDVFEELEVRHM